MYYYMLSDPSLPVFMKDKLDKTYGDMQRVTNEREFRRLIENAPCFIFDKANDFMQAIRADYIVILVPPDKWYQFEILSYDPYSSKIIVDSIEYKKITIERFSEIVMDHYPISVSVRL